MSVHTITHHFCVSVIIININEVECGDDDDAEAPGCTNATVITMQLILVILSFVSFQMLQQELIESDNVTTSKIQTSSTERTGSNS